MDTHSLKYICAWFEDYVCEFERMQGGLHPLLELKVDHSRRVAHNCREIAEGIGSEGETANCCEAIGLLHDIGRFRQFAQYGTLSDKDSIDHGEAGYLLLQDLGTLAYLMKSDQQAILNSVRYHNRREIPEDIPEASLPYLEVVRDADKLDILRIVVEELNKDGFQHLDDIKTGVSRSFQPSQAAVDEVLQRRSMAMDTVASLGDFLLLQLSWVYDLNHSPARRMLLQSGALDQLAQHIEGGEKTAKLVDQMRSYCKDKK